ncbi:hypothetical protein [Cohnella terricola]|uniref:Uncharacterized protein n=1 Tax=Cohnella terricola TaxID=1289167 RepID=A0A559JL79_9BACL|nr:hypothetical protein [Cohnella terricola]TVY00631.1 hypothetical protein FPZ45_11515 [Cohnella terricola]
MRDAALLAVWLIGLFTLIGGVLAAVARFVRRDSARYDEQFTWAAFLTARVHRREDPQDKEML